MALSGGDAFGELKWKDKRLIKVLKKARFEHRITRKQYESMKGQVLSGEGESVVKGLLNFVQDETPMKLQIRKWRKAMLEKGEIE